MRHHLDLGKIQDHYDFVQTILPKVGEVPYCSKILPQSHLSQAFANVLYARQEMKSLESEGIPSDTPKRTKPSAGKNIHYFCNRITFYLFLGFEFV